MTRKELEKRCREEMQQNIPDREALWQRIENSLGEQPAHPDVPHIRVTHTARYAVTAAACLLFAAGGVILWGSGFHRMLDTAKNETADMAVQDQADEAYDAVADADVDPADAEMDLADEDMDFAPAAQDEVYDGDREANADKPADAPQAMPDMAADNDADAADNAGAADTPKADIPTTIRQGLQLYAQDPPFSEEQVLGDTQLFLKALVTDVTQGEQGLTYTLEAEETHRKGDMVGVGTLTLTSTTPYVMQQGHTYLLALREEGEGWALVCDSAPQIEQLSDGSLLVHPGWESLMPYITEELNAPDGSVLYHTDTDAADALFDAWLEY